MRTCDFDLEGARERGDCSTSELLDVQRGGNGTLLEIAGDRVCFRVDLRIVIFIGKASRIKAGTVGKD